MPAIGAIANPPNWQSTLTIRKPPWRSIGYGRRGWPSKTESVLVLRGATGFASFLESEVDARAVPDNHRRGGRPASYRRARAGRAGSRGARAGGRGADRPDGVGAQQRLPHAGAGRDGDRLRRA